MTMLLGINFEDYAFLSADTRMTDSLTKKTKDNIQKIEFLPTHNLIIAAAGRARIAFEVIQAIYNGLIEIPITKKSISKNIDKIIGDFVKKEVQKKIALLNPLEKGIALLVHQYYEGRINMRAIRLQFQMQGTKITPVISEYLIKKGQYATIGEIGRNAPIQISDLPRSSQKHLRQNDPQKITYQDYELATSMILKRAETSGSITIGGKTISIKTFIDSNGSLKYIAIHGLKSIIHKKGEYQDVSTATDFDPSSNRFYLRDIRNEGMIITNIDDTKPDFPPMLRYDSCPKDSGQPNIYYKKFSDHDVNQSMNLELEL